MFYEFVFISFYSLYLDSGGIERQKMKKSPSINENRKEKKTKLNRIFYFILHVRYAHQDGVCKH